MSQDVYQEDKIIIYIGKGVFRVTQEVMTGSELRALPTPPIGAEQSLYLEVPGGDDLLIKDSESVTLKDGMHFFTAPATINAGCINVTVA